MSSWNDNCCLHVLFVANGTNQGGKGRRTLQSCSYEVSSGGGERTFGSPPSSRDGTAAPTHTDGSRLEKNVSLGVGEEDQRRRVTKRTRHKSAFY